MDRTLNCSHCMPAVTPEIHFFENCAVLVNLHLFSTLINFYFMSLDMTDLSKALRKAGEKTIIRQTS